MCVWWWTDGDHRQKFVLAVAHDRVRGTTVRFATPALSVPAIHTLSSQLVRVSGTALVDVTAATRGSGYDSSAFMLSSNCGTIGAAELSAVGATAVVCTQFSGGVQLTLSVNGLASGGFAAGAYKLCVRWEATQGWFDEVAALNIGECACARAA